MICSAIQMDSFWKTLVLSKLWESSMRAIVIEPPRFGVAAWRVVDALAARAAVAARTTPPTDPRKKSGLLPCTCTPFDPGLGTGVEWCIQHTVPTGNHSAMIGSSTTHAAGA